jgi:hypothetical protein
VILALHDLNTAVEEKNLKAMSRALKNPGFNVTECISATDEVLYFSHLLVCIRHLLFPSSMSTGLMPQARNES